MMQKSSVAIRNFSLEAQNIIIIQFSFIQFAGKMISEHFSLR